MRFYSQSSCEANLRTCFGFQEILKRTASWSLGDKRPVLEGNLEFPTSLTAGRIQNEASDIAGPPLDKMNETRLGEPRGQIAQTPHDAGTCVPCVFYASKQGCANADACWFCHSNHPKVGKRPRKQLRDACKEMLEDVFKNKVGLVKVWFCWNLTQQCEVGSFQGNSLTFCSVSA